MKQNYKFRNTKVMNAYVWLSTIKIVSSNHWSAGETATVIKKYHFHVYSNHKILKINNDNVKRFALCVFPCHSISKRRKEKTILMERSDCRWYSVKDNQKSIAIIINGLKRPWCYTYLCIQCALIWRKW